jgi:hypothetical protein
MLRSISGEIIRVFLNHVFSTTEHRMGKLMLTASSQRCEKSGSGPIKDSI